MLYIGADHGGFLLKEKLKEWFKEVGYHGQDLGASKLNEEDDFIDYGLDVGQMVAVATDAMGIVICRNGVGMDIVANRFKEVRCVLGFDEGQVERARADDDVNVLALPADYIDFELAKKLVKKFLDTKFSGESRYKRRLAKLEMASGMIGGGGGCCGGGGGCCDDDEEGEGKGCACGKH